MNLRRLRRRCQARLDALDLPAPFDAREFCGLLGRRRGRPIRLHPVSGLAGLCGVWVAGADEDFIVYESATSPLHRQHIIVHEVAHLLCDHRSASVLDAACSRLFFPDLDADMVRSVLGRARYSAEEEQEAELLASLILERAGRRGPPPTRRTGDAQLAALQDRLAAAFERPQP